MRKRFFSLLLGVLVLVSIIPGPAFADKEMIEADELDGSTAIGAAYGNIQPYSPIHSGDAATGADEWTAINSQFNEPRTGTGYLTHHGVDFATNYDLVRRDGRPVWGTMLTGTVSRVATSNGSYGKTVEVSHSIYVNGVYYYYRDRYAHLHSISVTQGASVGQRTQVGVSGDTGLNCTNPCVHLHYEFLTNTATDSTGSSPSGLRRYSPSFFYNTQAPTNWGSDTSFITREPAGTNQASFRLTVASDFASASYGNVKLWYNAGSGWTSTTNWIKNGDIYTVDFKALGVAGGTSVQFYVQADSSGFDGSNLRTGWRPWRNDNSPPGGTTSTNSRPFTMYIY